VKCCQEEEVEVVVGSVTNFAFVVTSTALTLAYSGWSYLMTGVSML